MPNSDKNDPLKRTYYTKLEVPKDRITITIHLDGEDQISLRANAVRSLVVTEYGSTVTVEYED